MLTDQHSVALTAFQEAFETFKYPFASSDKLLEAHDSGYRAMYYEKAKTLSTDEVLKQEIEEMKRGIIQHLAMKTLSELEMAADRVAFLAIEAFEKRLQVLADRVKNLELKKLVDRL